MTYKATKEFIAIVPADATNPEMRYLRALPTAPIRPGWYLVHNNVRPAQLGVNGFRAWITPADPRRYAPCACGWAAHLGPHYIRAVP